MKALAILFALAALPACTGTDNRASAVAPATGTGASAPSGTAVVTPARTFNPANTGY